MLGSAFINMGRIMMDRELLDLSQVQNEQSFNYFSLTADVDWAPDYAVDDYVSIIADAGMQASVYATHDSDALRGIDDVIEVGLHPDNTRPHPEHGLNRKILDLKELYPSAVGVRCHRNFFGQNIAQQAVAADLTYDASVFLWQHPHLRPWKDQYGLIRMAYNWEDGIQADYGLPWDMSHVPFDGPGMKVFNFHPIFVYLNCPNDDYRRKVVSDYKDLTSAPKDKIEPLIYQGYGARNFLIDMLTELKSRGARCVRLQDVAVAARKLETRKS